MGMKNKGTWQSGFQHMLAESCRVRTKERGTQVGTPRVAAGMCCYTAAVSGTGYRKCKQPFSGATTHPCRPHSKPACVAGSEEQKRAEEASFMLQSHMRDRSCPQQGEGAQGTDPLPASPREPTPVAALWAVLGTHGNLSPSTSTGESAVHPRQEILAFASSYLLRDLELFHHAKLVVHLNATFHQL